MKYSFFIFDLDGVLLNSINNMNYSWIKTKKKFKLKKGFLSYKKLIGLPFNQILKKLSIKNNLKEITNYYKKISNKEMNKLDLYPDVLKMLNQLKKKKIRFSIVTSKDYQRTKEILKYFKIKPVSLHCPKKNLRGKPYPDQILECLKKNKIKKIKDTCYVGDTNFDYLSSKKAGISFIFCKYGYGKNSVKFKNKINNFKDLKKFIN